MPATPGQKIIIAGAGIPGLTLALALKRSLGNALEVTICDPAINASRTAGRASAVAAGPKRMFEALGIWAGLDAGAQPIHSMVITDSRLRDGLRPAYLQFGGDITPGEPFAHMAEDHLLAAALAQASREAGTLFVASSIDNATLEPGRIIARLGDGTARPCHLMVASDGGKSRLRMRMRLAVTGWPYRQSGVVATFAHENPHEGRAEEHFLPDGPFAVLPLSGNRISIVWTQSTENAVRTLALPEAEFVKEVQACIGFHLGDMTLLDRPRAFPLSLQIARKLVAPRFALMGDAAHVIHPIAGQGLNLGLRDVAALAEVICAQVQLGLDIGAEDRLEDYQRQRRFDTLTMAATTDMLNRLFGNDFIPLRMARDLGLGLVDRMPGLKRYFIHEAGGVGGNSRLLQGLWP